MNEYQAFYEMVKKWTVNDYRTQAIKSEVIIDMLISDFIEEMVTARLSEIDSKISLNDVKLLAKEFPIDISSSDLRNAKVDFLVSVKDRLYLIELKTSEDSHSSDQKSRMLTVVDDGAEDLLDFFFRIIAGKRKKPSKLDSKKYFYTLKKMQNKFYNDEINFVSDEQFRHDLIQKYSNTEMDIIYIELSEPKNLDFLKINNDKNIKTIVLNKLDTCDKFKNLLSDDKKDRWSLVSQIIAEMSPETKSKIFRNNNNDK